MEDATLRATFTQAANQSARIDALESGDIPRSEKIFEAGTRLPMVRLLGQLAHDQTTHPGSNRLVARVGHAIVTDLRMGHYDHLAAI